MDRESIIASYTGPFYTKDENGNMVMAEMCRECAFGSEDFCALSPCTYLESACQGELENA
jgi:hypothetical protein